MNNNIAKIIENGSKLIFKPTIDFYDFVRVNKKRWSAIYKGKTEPTQSELLRISNYFNIPITAFFTSTTQESKVPEEQSI